MHDELIERLAGFPDRVAALFDRVAPAQRLQAPAGGGFCWTEHLCHLRDLEREGFQVRIARIVAEDMPQLQEIDGTTLAQERHYRGQDAAVALAAWRAARAETVALLRRELPAQASRRGIFGGFGVVTLQALAEGIAAHDAAHQRELEALAG